MLSALFPSFITRVWNSLLPCWFWCFESYTFMFFHGERALQTWLCVLKFIIQRTFSRTCLTQPRNFIVE
jgi:hypothetical protein